MLSKLIIAVLAGFAAGVYCHGGGAIRHDGSRIGYVHRNLSVGAGMKIYWFYEEDCRICPRCGIEHTKREGCVL